MPSKTDILSTSNFMRKTPAIILLAAGCAMLWSAEWPTDGGNTKRDNWQRDEKVLTPENVKNLQILWKIKLDNQPQEMHSLFPPLVVDNIDTPQGRRQI